MADGTEVVYVLSGDYGSFAAFRTLEGADRWVEENEKRFDQYNAEHAAWVSRYTWAQSAWIQENGGGWSDSDVRSELEKEYRGIHAKHDVKTLVDPERLTVTELELRP